MTNWTNEPLTLEKLQAMHDLVKDIPPPPFFGSSRLLPSDGFVRFTYDGREFFGGHPDLWEKLPKGTLPPKHQLGSIEIYNLDVYRDKMAEFNAALASAMTKRRYPVLRTDLPV